MSFSFKAKGKEYTVDVGDAFMDNTSCIQFMPKDSSKLKSRRIGLMSYTPTVSPSKAEWKRIKPLLTSMTYREYAPFKLNSGADSRVVMYVLK